MHNIFEKNIVAKAMLIVIQRERLTGYGTSYHAIDGDTGHGRPACGWTIHIRQAKDDRLDAVPVRVNAQMVLSHEFMHCPGNQRVITVVLINRQAVNATEHIC